MGEMEKDRRKARRVLKLQRRVKYAGPGESPPDVFSLCVPRDVVERMSLEPGENFRFVALGNILAYERMGAD